MPSRVQQGGSGAAAVSEASLRKARANELLTFLRAEQARTETDRLPVSDWINNVSILGGVDKMSDAERSVRESLEYLDQEGRIKIERARSHRWLVREWVVKLLALS